MDVASGQRSPTLEDVRATAPSAFRELRWALEACGPMDSQALAFVPQVGDAVRQHWSVRAGTSGALALTDPACELWVGRCDITAVNGSVRTWTVLCAMTHRADRWGQPSTQARTLVVDAAEGDVVLAMDTVDDLYGVFDSQLRTVLDGSLAVAALLLHAPEPVCGRWEGLERRQGFEWVAEAEASGRFWVDGAERDASLEYF